MKNSELAWIFTGFFLLIFAVLFLVLEPIKVSTLIVISVLLGLTMTLLAKVIVNKIEKENR